MQAYTILVSFEISGKYMQPSIKTGLIVKQHLENYSKKILNSFHRLLRTDIFKIPGSNRQF